MKQQIKILSALFSLFLTTEMMGQVTVRDIGVVGLYSHDLFQWDREQEVSLENGLLDLSTIFDYEDGKRWKRGGNPKNSENAPVYSITMDLVDAYKDFLKNAEGSDAMKKEIARKQTVALFKSWVEKSFESITNRKFPSTGINSIVNNDEQAAMRCLHDVLPGRIDLYRRWDPRKTLKVTDWKFTRTRLNEKELDQTIPYFDGEYAPEYLAIQIPFVNKKINLREADKKFVSRFSEIDFEFAQDQLKEVGLGKMKLQDLSLMPYLVEMAQKSICSDDNPWIDQTIECN